MRRARQEEGIGLVELLIAMTVLAVGITAIVAGFSSGMVALNEASRASTAGAVADQKMEAYRQVRYNDPSLDIGSTSVTQAGPDGRTYWVGSDVSWTCATGTYDNSTTPPSCTGGAVLARPMKLVTITVRDGPLATDELLFRATSTFDCSTGTPASDPPCVSTG